MIDSDSDHDIYLPQNIRSRQPRSDSGLLSSSPKASSNVELPADHDLEYIVEFNVEVLDQEFAAYDNLINKLR